jgi:hypothetical protein
MGTMIKKLINKILRKFGYHLTKMPGPYQRKSRVGFGCPDHGHKYVEGCAVCRYLKSPQSPTIEIVEGKIGKPLE